MLSLMRLGRDPLPVIEDVSNVKNREISALLDQAHGYADEYLNDVDTRVVVPTDESIANLSVFDESMPLTGTDGKEALALLHSHGSPATVAQGGGRYFGFVNGGVHPPALAARWLADAWDQNAALYVMSPIVAKLEGVCERWLTELFRLPEETAVGFVGGTSTSLLCGLAAARGELLRRQAWDVGEHGLMGAPAIRVVVGAQAHGAVLKTLSLLGLGRGQVEFVPVDEQGAMLAAAVPVLDDKTLLIVQAGNVNTGAFDPMTAICTRARKANACVHVDGAFGLWAAASASTYPLYEGAELADSWSVDAHKTLNVPYDCGIVLCRNREALLSALQASGTYLQWSENRDGMAYTPDMSRRGRSMELWIALKTMGKQGVEALIDQLCERAKLFARLFAENGFRVLNDVVFNQVLIACDSSEQTRRTLGAVQTSGECWCGTTMWNDEPAIRVSVSRPEDKRSCQRSSVSLRLINITVMVVYFR